MKVFERLLKVVNNKGAGYLVLIDPDTRKGNELKQFVKEICSRGVDAILVGGSLIINSDFEGSLRLIKESSTVPVIIFPGSVRQISSMADAILFISLISGRNPDFLFGEHVIAAPIIRKLNIEPISSGYMLFESGKTTTAEFMSNTKPLPPNKPEIAVAHALAAQYLGMQTIYLEAGSGAENSVPKEIVKAVSKYMNIPIITGGGIKKPDVAREKVEAGSNFIVTGNVLDNTDNLDIINEFARAVHIKEFL
jgi:putative glycerol-1-phosphate prenyltransferase